VIEAALAVAVLAAIGYGFWHIRKKKAQDTKQSYWIETSSLHVSVQSTISPAAGEIFAAELHKANVDLWPKFSALYGIKEPRRVIGLVRLIDGVLTEDHPHVLWHTGTNAIRLRVQPGMVRWFALELHNAFRAAALGYGHIYATMNDDDRNHAIEAQKYIDHTYTS